MLGRPQDDAEWSKPPPYFDKGINHDETVQISCIQLCTFTFIHHLFIPYRPHYYQVTTIFRVNSTYAWYHGKG